MLVKPYTPCNEWKNYGGECEFLLTKKMEEAPHLMTKSKVKPVPDLDYYFKDSLPESTYTTAPMNYSDVIEGLNKYYEQPLTEPTLNHVLEKIIAHFDLDINPLDFQAKMITYFNAYMPDFNHAYRELTNDEVLYNAVHDPSGDVRHPTSSGYGTNYTRQEIARLFSKSVKIYLDNPQCNHEVLFTLFLKDEIREKGKATRSIAVPQLHLWLMFNKFMGWIYEYFSNGKHPFAYGHTPNEGFFTDLFYQFNLDEETFSIDFKKMDSRMNHVFVTFLENYIITQTNFPKERLDVITWIHDVSFFEKQVMDPRGNVVTFTNGEMSGFPGTILYNSFYALYLIVISQIVHMEITEQNTLELIPLAILGDDIAFQQLDLEIVKQCATLLGHDLYIQRGSLINDVTFLSYKFDYHNGYLRPYYANDDKMFAAFRFYKDEITYFQKLASFHSLLAFAPDDSEEAYWRDEIEKILLWLIKTDSQNIYSAVRASFKPTQVWRNLRQFYSPAILGINEWAILND